MAAVDVDLIESVQVQVPGALLVVRSIYISLSISAIKNNIHIYLYTFTSRLRFAYIYINISDIT